MLLRSSSTPVLGSLLSSSSSSSSSFGESPSNNNNNHDPHQPELPTKPSPCFHHNYCYGKLSCFHHPASSLYKHNSSPSIFYFYGTETSRFRRRAQSEGNLQALVGGASTYSNDVDEFTSLKRRSVPARHHHSHNMSTLEPIPSFSLRNSNAPHCEDEDSEEEDVGEEEQNGDSLRVRSSLGNVDFKTKDRRYRNVGFEEGMYLAKGIGLGVADVSYVCNGNHGHGGGGKGCKPVAYDGDGGDNSNHLSIEEHYKRLLEENPSNPLYLRNYAQFLHQTKRDLESADEYYSRAILADPKDGEVLSQYANLIWKLYRSKDRATNYFERAVQASAEDSHVHAAYASFLWENEDEDEDEVEASGDDDAPAVPALLHGGITA